MLVSSAAFIMCIVSSAAFDPPPEAAACEVDTAVLLQTEQSTKATSKMKTHLDLTCVKLETGETGKHNDRQETGKYDTPYADTDKDDTATATAGCIRDYQWRARWFANGNLVSEVEDDGPICPGVWRKWVIKCVGKTKELFIERKDDLKLQRFTCPEGFMSLSQSCR